VFLVKLIVRWVRQIASHHVIKNELNGFFRGLSGKRGEASVIGWEAVKNNAERPVCCSNGSTGGVDQKTDFPWGHGDPVREWE